jgi:hypothetical protein
MIIDWKWDCQNQKKKALLQVNLRPIQPAG